MSDQIRNLGEMEGPLLLFGGVYSNYQALEALVATADQLGIATEHIISTGDVVGYCAQPEECIQLMIEKNILSIAGNVELQLRMDAEDCGCDFKVGGRCDVFSRQWYPYAKSVVSTASQAWLDTLPEFIQFAYAGHRLTILHGSWKRTSEFIFGSTAWDVKEENFHASESSIIIAGHCGLPFSQQNGNKHWLNPGVIGMPANDGSSDVWYMLLGDRDGQLQVSHHRLSYDHQLARQMMIERNLPLSYAETLSTGIWDNCEILPPTEAALQGKKLKL